MSHIEDKITLVCYDITSNKLRRKIDKAMKDFGVRLQYSLFLCRLDADGVRRCRDKLETVLAQYHTEKEPGDSIIILERLHSDSATSLLGKGLASAMQNYSIV